MVMDISRFEFTSSPVATSQDVIVAVVGPKLSTREELFGSIAKQLGFPSYFGMNWDALEECLRDLSWVEARKVVIWHDALPEALGEDELRIYLQVLSSCAKHWTPNKSHELTVIFPASMKMRILNLQEH